MVARIKAYRAPDNVETSLRYADGHRKVLEAYGVKKVTSSSYDWLEDPNTYVIIVESEDGSRIFGGTRVQVRSPKLNMPMEGAIAKIDDTIYDYVNKIGDYNVAEFCGLFNSKEVAGYGIGSVYLGRTAMAISSMVGIKYLMGLCSPITLVISQRIGFEVLTDLGNNGTFYYPKEGLIATSLIARDLINLPLATPEEQEKIFSLRENPQQTVTENGRRGELTIIYDIKQWD
ncbi:hypothetical protein [Dyadobacter psychrotolerans]|uniref:GNAT family N-acetyltransferase n=1 Tax=Dyadobacter psychrotolerans TaxID=2541721 RepID=A0A4R5DUK2_9BACT|nr:hypothetical protein [Dyadobacter psychrotolerans]TDE18172.1 hypothetical protein E0F88_01100 [Dyadobacter psychrotolerans]